MTEYDLFIQCVPMIAEIVVRAKRMTEEQYRDWKQEQEKALKASGQKSNSFALKVLEVIDTYRGREVAV
mgnify:FL=1